MEGGTNTDAGDGSRKDTGTSSGNPAQERAHLVVESPTPVAPPPTVQKQRRRKSAGAEDKPQKKSKPNSDNKGSLADFGFHRLCVKEGEDVSTEIMLFAERCRQPICVTSAVGKVLYVKVTNANQVSHSRYGPKIKDTYEGKYEILRLNGGFVPLQDEPLQISGGLNIHFAVGNVMSIFGRVAGQMIAASPVTVNIIKYPPSTLLQRTIDKSAPNPEPAPRPGVSM